MTTLTPEDRARLRDRALNEAHAEFGNTEMLSVLDALDAETSRADRAKAAARTLGGIVERQCRDIARIAAAEHLVQDDGDADWGMIWDLAEERATRGAAAEAAVERVRALHVRVPYADAPEYGYCGRCQRGGAAGVWPCETLRALDGDA